MMNKGLELIEAARLFGLPSAAIGVLVHPQSVVHGLVYYRDGSVLAQLGSPGHARADRAHAGLAGADGDGRAAARPRRRSRGWSSSSAGPGALPGAAAGARGLAAGGGAPTILSAANEMAVEAFLHRRIGFLDIAAIG